jgi:hypothetical protein
MSGFNMVREKFLEARIAVFFNLLADKGCHGRKLATHKSATTVAFSARKAFLIHLSAVALDAGDLFDIFGIFIGRNEQVTSNIHVFDLDIHLRSSILHLSDDTTAASVSHLCVGL